MKPQTTKEQVISSLENLSSCMETTYKIMEKSDIDALVVHTEQLRGARKMLGTWIEGISGE